MQETFNVFIPDPFKVFINPAWFEIILTFLVIFKYPACMRYFSVNLSFFLVCAVTATPVYSENIIYQWLEHNKTFFLIVPMPMPKLLPYRIPKLIIGLNG